MRRAILLLAAMAAALVLASGAALAYTLIGETADPATIGANGRIWSIVAAGDTVYLGGTFTQLTDTDGKSYSRNNLAAIDANTGRLMQDWNPNATRDPKATSEVRAMALSSDGSRLFVGGTFSSVSGQPHSRLAAVDTTTGQATSWNPGKVTGSVYALEASASRLYAGGSFTAVDGQPRENLAAVDSSTGRLDGAWKPRAYRGDGGSATVRALHLSADGNLLYAGGLFNHISEARTLKLAAIDATTGALDTTSGDVQAIRVWDETVYAGGHGILIGGLIRKRLYAADASTGKILDWDPVVPGSTGSLGVWSLEVDAGRGRLYAGGDFTQVSGVPHQRFAQVSD